MPAKPDPSPAEIEQLCREIQAGWSERERMARLRSDLRPTFTMADGRRGTMTSEDYEGHHSERAELQTGP